MILLHYILHWEKKDDEEGKKDADGRSASPSASLFRSSSSFFCHKTQRNIIMKVHQLAPFIASLEVDKLLSPSHTSVCSENEPLV